MDRKITAEYFLKKFFSEFFNTNNYSYTIFDELILFFLLLEHLIKNIETHQNYSNHLQNHFFQEIAKLEQQKKDKLLLLEDLNGN